MCDEFFSLPLFPQSSCAFKDASAVAADTTASTAGTTTGCGCQNTTAGSNRGCGCRVSKMCIRDRGMIVCGIGGAVMFALMVAFGAVLQAA